METAKSDDMKEAGWTLYYSGGWQRPTAEVARERAQAEGFITKVVVNLGESCWEVWVKRLNDN